MAGRIPSRTAHHASVAMAASGLAMATHLAERGRPTVITALIVTSALLAVVAAREVRRDDVLGWTMAVGHALLTVATVTVLLTIGMPGLHISGWTLPTVTTVATATLVLIAALRASRRRSTTNGAGVPEPVLRVR